MPHKHTRRMDGDDSNFDLAPTRVAKPLPNFDKPSKVARTKKDGKVQKPKRQAVATSGYKEDDTPRAFARLIAQQSGKRLASGLDDGNDRRSKKRKLVEASAQVTTKLQAEKADPAPELRRLPGESMSEFSARVDQALPVSGLTRKGNPKIGGLKERQTKTEKRLHKMYAAWREEEARRNERLEEVQERAEEEEDEKEAELGGQSIAVPTSRKARRRKQVGEVDDSDDDPWKALEGKKERPKGLHDVVKAPPTFKAIPREKFKVRNGAKVDVANVPTSAGSLKKREELGEARKEVIERYRAMMKAGNK